MLRLSAMEFWLLLLAVVFIVCGIDFIVNPQDIRKHEGQLTIFHFSELYMKE